MAVLRAANADAMECRLPTPLADDLEENAIEETVARRGQLHSAASEAQLSEGFAKAYCTIGFGTCDARSHPCVRDVVRNLMPTARATVISEAPFAGSNGIVPAVLPTSAVFISTCASSESPSMAALAIEPTFDGPMSSRAIIPLPPSAAKPIVAGHSPWHSLASVAGFRQGNHTNLCVEDLSSEGSIFIEMNGHVVLAELIR